MSEERMFLIVDDDEDDRDYFCEAILAIDRFAKCETAIDGEDALAKLSTYTQQLPDFIFLDINMPRLDGWKCLTELKKKPKAKKYSGHHYINFFLPKRS